MAHKTLSADQRYDKIDASVHNAGKSTKNGSEETKKDL